MTQPDEQETDYLLPVHGAYVLLKTGPSIDLKFLKQSRPSPGTSSYPVQQNTRFSLPLFFHRFPPYSLGLCCDVEIITDNDIPSRRSQRILFNQ